MIVLLRGSINSNIALTLTENVTIQDPVFLFEFINESSGKKHYVVSSDTSTYKERYNLFTIEEGVNDQLNGKVVLGALGGYRYNVYEQATAQLDPTGLNKVESGKMKLIGLGDNTQRYEGNSSEYKVYER